MRRINCPCIWMLLPAVLVGLIGGVVVPSSASGQPLFVPEHECKVIFCSNIIVGPLSECGLVECQGKPGGTPFRKCYPNSAETCFDPGGFGVKKCDGMCGETECRFELQKCGTDPPEA